MVGKKKIINTIFWGLIIVIIALNLFLLQRVKQNALGEFPLEFLDIKKPTIVIVLDEFACITCVQELLFLNDIYTELKTKNEIEIIGVILSETKTDQKNIAQAFLFPFEITDNLNILRRLNLNKTPVIIGISKDKRIFYSDLITRGTRISIDFVKKGVLDRLYFSLNE